MASIAGFDHRSVATRLHHLQHMLGEITPAQLAELAGTTRLVGGGAGRGSAAQCKCQAKSKRHEDEQCDEEWGHRRVLR